MSSSATGQTAATADASPGVLRRAIGASAIGNATEWFDYGIYAYGVTVHLAPRSSPGSTEDGDAVRAARPSRSRSSSVRSAASSGVRWATGWDASRSSR